MSDLNTLTAGFQQGLTFGLNRITANQEAKQKTLEFVANQQAELKRQKDLADYNRENTPFILADAKGNQTLTTYGEQKNKALPEETSLLKLGSQLKQAGTQGMSPGSEAWSNALDLVMKGGASPTSIMSRMPGLLRVQFAGDLDKLGFDVNKVGQIKVAQDVSTNKQIALMKTADKNLNGLQQAVENMDFTGTNALNNLARVISNGLGTEPEATLSALRSGNIDDISMLFSRGGVPTDAARSLASGMLNSTTKEGIASQIKIARQFIANQVSSYQEAGGKKQKPLSASSNDLSDDMINAMKKKAGL